MLCGFTLMEAVTAWLLSYNSFRISGKFAATENTGFFWHVLHLPMRFFSQRMAGDIEQRRAFIDENFKPYAMFYDSKNNRWRNTMLQALYEGGTSVLSKTHDLISIFNNNNNAKYDTHNDSYLIGNEF